MNKNQIVHQERKEYWRELIKQCDASGQTQQEWCQENKVCSASLSRWRNQIWREEEAEKEFAAIREEHCFVEIKQEETSATEIEAVTLRAGEKAPTVRNMNQAKRIRYNQEEPRLIQPDAVIGYREYMVGVYEHTSTQVLQKVMEVLKYA